MQDAAVSWRHAPRLVERLAEDDAVLTLVKDGDHRLSRPGASGKRLITAIEALAAPERARSHRTSTDSNGPLVSRNDPASSYLTSRIVVELRRAPAARATHPSCPGASRDACAHRSVHTPRSPRPAPSPSGMPTGCRSAGEAAGSLSHSWTGADPLARCAAPIVSVPGRRGVACLDRALRPPRIRVVGDRRAPGGDGSPTS